MSVFDIKDENYNIDLADSGIYFEEDDMPAPIAQEAALLKEIDFNMNYDINNNMDIDDCCSFHEPKPIEESVYKVKKYLPNPAQSDYRTSSSTTKTWEENKFFVEVQFPSSNKRYDYLCDIADIKLDDYVLVPTGNEQKKGKVVGVKYRTFTEMPLPARYYKKVISKSTELHIEKTQTTKSYYVMVEFEDGGKEYTYKCDLPNIHIGDFVRVKAQGKKKTVRITDVLDSWDSNIRSKVLRLATDDEVWEWKYGKNEEHYADDDLYEDSEPEPELDDDYQSNSYSSYGYENQYQPQKSERRLPSPEEFMADPRLIIEWETRLPENAEDWWTASTDPRYWMLEYNLSSNEKAAERKREEEAKKQAEEESWRRYYDDDD